MDYSYPVQLTQWALASAPVHPVLSRYMESRSEDLKDDFKRAGEIIKEHEMMIATLRAQVTSHEKASKTVNRGIEELNICLHALTGLLNTRPEDEDA